MERQSASASLDSGCRDDPYHPPSCRPGIVTVTVPDSLSFSSSLSLSISLFLFLCLAIDPYLVLRRHRRPSPPRARRAFSSEGSSIVLSLSRFSALSITVARTRCGFRPASYGARCNCQVSDGDVSISAEQVDWSRAYFQFVFFLIYMIVNIGNIIIIKEQVVKSFTKIIYAQFFHCIFNILFLLTYISNIYKRYNCFTLRLSWMFY